MTELSILEVLKKGRFQSSLMVTYNASLPFYEHVVLPALRNGGCRQNLVLMDRNQCAMAWASASLRPRYAGHTYSLVPVSVPGAFHPKILLLKGEKTSQLLVGSHNLTLSGYGINREITNLVDGPFPRAVGMEDLYLHLRSWLADSNVHSDVHAGIDAYFPDLVDTTLESTWSLKFQMPGASLWEQVLAHLTTAPYRILVMGAFFDCELRFLRVLKEQWPAARVRVVIDPRTVSMPLPPSDLDVEWADLNGVIPDDDRKRLHAKFVLFETDRGGQLWNGSANPSAPAWLDHKRANAECMLLRKGIDSTAILHELGLHDVWEVAPLDPGVLTGGIQGANFQIDSEEVGSSLLVGRVVAQERIIEVPGLDLESWHHLEYRDEFDKTMKSEVVASVGSRLEIPDGLRSEAIRSLWLESNLGLKPLRVMLHHPDRIRRQTMSEDHRRMEELLLDLGGRSDVADLVAALERLLVAPPAAGRGVEVPLKTMETKEQESEVPVTLELDSRLVVEQRKQALENEATLLLELLGQRIVGVAAEADNEHGYEPSEEELVGLEVEQTQETVEVDFDRDAAISKKVIKSFRRILRRHLSLLQIVKANPQDHSYWAKQGAVLLLFARELLCAEELPRWRGKNLPLMDMDDFEQLLEASVIVAAHWPRIEASFLYVCLWSAWRVGLDWKQDNYWTDLEEVPNAPWRKAVLASLLSLPLHQADWAPFDAVIENRSKAQDWVLRHNVVSDRFCQALVRSQEAVPFKPLGQGDVVIPPGDLGMTAVLVRRSGSMAHILDLVRPTQLRGETNIRKILASVLIQVDLGKE